MQILAESGVAAWDAFIAETREGIHQLRTFDGPDEARQKCARELYQNVTGAAQDLRHLGWTHPRLAEQLAALDELAAVFLQYL